MKVGVKHILLLGILGFLFLPLVQNVFHIRKVKKLSGHYVPAENISFEIGKWWSKEFQEKKEKYLNDHFGFRNNFVRIHNQIAFWLFKTAKANGVIVGKQNYLYEKAYIDAYYGADFNGVDSIQRKMKMISMLVDTFQKQNKTMFLVFAPGKAAFYPEFIPESKKSPRGITNIEVYLHYAKAFNIPHIDFHSWFLQNKNKSTYPLIPQYGIHWSDYGAYLAMDSILKQIEKLRKIEMIHPTLKKYHLKAWNEQDHDVEKGMNLMFKCKNQVTALPELVYEDTIGKVRPSIIVVADSYYWQMINYGITNCFDPKKADFWYYFGSAHNPTFKEATYVDHLDVYKEVDEHQVIVLMATDANLKKFGWNFIEKMYEHYYGALPAIDEVTSFNKRVMEQRLLIEKDSAWLSSIYAKAAENGISKDSMIYIDAEWVVRHQKK